jgi:iron complex transport system permease protein
MAAPLPVAAATAPGPRRDRLVTVRIPLLQWSTRLHARAIAVTLVVTGLAVLVFAWSLTVGDFPLPFGEVLASLVGRGSKSSDFIINTLRMPRALTGLLVGASFGLSGAIFQRLVRNPLASPDLIGVNFGAVAIYVLAYKRGVSGYRLVLIGIGVTALLQSVVSYLLTRAEIFDAQRATVWLTGSLNGRGWEHVRPVTIALLVLVPVTVGLARHLRMLELGDDAAMGLGVRVEWSRAALLLTATALAALATASAGPVAFVALVAPQIARRLVGGRSLGLIPAAACGALLLVASDLVGRRVFAPTELPVGVITGILGAPYLLYLLARANRIGASG